MANVSGEMYSVGARRAVLFRLNAAGYPIYGSASATPYEGIEVLGVKSFDLTIPPVRKIVHSGNDRVLAFDFLPAIEGAGGGLTVAGRSLSLDAMISGVIQRTVGETKMIAQDTDLQGSEPDVALFVMQQAKDATLRSRRYRYQIIPKCVISSTPPGQSEAVAETKYDIAISPTVNHLWGTAFTVADDGCTEAAVIEGMSEGRPNLVAWLGDNVITGFNLPTSKPATATSKIHGVWVNGVPDATFGKTVTTITPTVKPGAGVVVVALYEY